MEGRFVPAWCSQAQPWWPRMYGHVQRQYWDVGLLRYWRLEQVPNFLLALPVLLVSTWGVLGYMRAWPHHCLWGGFFWPGCGWMPPPSQMSHTTSVAPAPQTSAARTVRASTRLQEKGHATSQKRLSKGRPQEVDPHPNSQEDSHAISQTHQSEAQSQGACPDISLQGTGSNTSQDPASPTRPQDADPPLPLDTQPDLDISKPGALAALAAEHVRTSASCNAGRDMLGPQAAVFMYPWAFMAVCALLVMHVQVATRFLSSSPALYWCMAQWWLQGTQRRGQLHENSPPSSHSLEMKRKRIQRSVERRGCTRMSVLLWGWCLGYTALGVVLFPNFYPWT